MVLGVPWVHRRDPTDRGLPGGPPDPRQRQLQRSYSGAPIFSHFFHTSRTTHKTTRQNAYMFHIFRPHKYATQAHNSQAFFHIISTFFSYYFRIFSYYFHTLGDTQWPAYFFTFFSYFPAHFFHTFGGIPKTTRGAAYFFHIFFTLYPHPTPLTAPPTPRPTTRVGAGLCHAPRAGPG